MRMCVKFGRTLFTPACYIAIFFQVVACVGMSRSHFVWDFPTSSKDRRPKMHTFFISPLQRSTSVSTVLNLEHIPPTLSLCSWMYLCYFNSELRIDHLKGFQWRIVMPVQNLEISTKINVYNYRKAHKRTFCSSGTLCRDRGALMCNTQSWNLVKMTWKPLTREILRTIQIVVYLFCSHPTSLHYVRGILFV